MPSPWELVVAVALCGGTFFTLVATIGLVRFPDVYCRMHAAGKAGTLGVGLVIIAVIVQFVGTDETVTIRGLLAVWFQLLTTPAATHLLARASYVTDYPLSDRTAVDDLQGHLASRPRDARGHE